MFRLIYFIFFASQFLQGQVPITLRNKLTIEPIPYANIWKDKSLYKTSDSVGVFYVDTKDVGDSIKITCIGFKDTIVKLSNEIILEPSAISLDEVAIVNRKFEKKVRQGKAKRGDSFYGVQWDSKMASVAKFFPNVNKEASFLSKVRFFVFTSSKNRKLIILIYSVDKDGKPGELLSNENIVFNPKKGNHIAEIDLEKLYIEFPKEGIFVVINHPLLEQNKLYSADNPNPNGFIYEPLVSVDFLKDYKDTWSYSEEEWKKNNSVTVNVELITTD
jgi:hypothetical protein